MTRRLSPLLILFCALPLLASCARTRAPGELASSTALAAAQPTAQPLAPTLWFEPHEIWHGIYFGKAKIGYQQIKFFPDRLDGQDVRGVKLYATMSFKALNVQLKQEVEMTQFLDKQGSPLTLTYIQRSGGMEQRVEAEFFPDRIDCVSYIGNQPKSKVIPIPPGVKLYDPEYGQTEFTMKPGDRLEYHYFNPVTLRIEKGAVEVLGDEQIKLGEETVPAHHVKLDTVVGTMEAWVDDKWEVVKAFHPLNLLIIKEPPEVAKTMEGPAGYSPPEDLAVVAAVKTKAKIEHPRQVRQLTVRLSGPIKRELFLDDGLRQRVTDLKTTGEMTSATIVVRSIAPPENPPQIPIRDPALAEFLKPTVHLQCDNPEIVQQAQEIVGEETDAFRAAFSIARWVSTNMSVRADIGLMRSALEVLHAREGVCRDYAALYTALARAVGIPSRMCSGVVYWEDGFYYHAWAESYVGQWLAFDPTQPPGYPVDATHIKLTQGDVPTMVDAIAAVGRISIEVLDYK